MKVRNVRPAFTLVELVMVIVIIGLMAAVVMPKFSSLKTEAQLAAQKGTVSAVTSGVKLAYMTALAQGTTAYPSTLDSAANGDASLTNLLFDTVIDGGVSDSNWRKTGARRYQYKPTGTIFNYDQTLGTFQ